MTEIGEPGKLQELKYLLQSVNLIETCQNKALITAEEKEKYIKTLNDKTHKIIEDLIGVL